MEIEKLLETTEYINNGKVVKDQNILIHGSLSELTAIQTLFAAASQLTNTISTEGDLSVPDMILLKEAVLNFPEILTSPTGQ